MHPLEIPYKSYWNSLKSFWNSHINFLDCFWKSFSSYYVSSLIWSVEGGYSNTDYSWLMRWSPRTLMMTPFSLPGTLQQSLEQLSKYLNHGLNWELDPFLIVANSHFCIGESLYASVIWTLGSQGHAREIAGDRTLEVRWTGCPFPCHR